MINLLNTALFSQAGVHKHLELCVLRSPDCKVPLKDVVLHIAPRASQGRIQKVKAGPDNSRLVHAARDSSNKCLH